MTKEQKEKALAFLKDMQECTYDGRDLTQEEKELYSSFYGLEPEYMIESRMPDDGEEVLVSAGGIVFKDNFSRDDFDFETISVDEIEAWMPLPQPYEEKRGNKDGSN